MTLATSHRRFHRRDRLRAAAAGVFFAAISSTTQAGAESLDGAQGPDAPSTQRTGPAVVWAAPPAGAERWPHACSFRHRVCVHAAPGTPGTTTMAALAAADRAWDTLTGPLGAPAPDGDADGVWRVYLVDGVDGARAFAGASDPLARFDRASSFALVDRGTPPGCELDLALARAVGRGSVWRAAPSTDPGTADAEVELLAHLGTTCPAPDGDVAAFETHPERSVVDPSSPAFDRGAALFFGWLDAAFGARPGALVVGLWALAPTKTQARAPSWAGTPTQFDVLRFSLASALWHGSTLDDVLVRFATDRAAMVPPPRVTWQIPWPAEARRLAGDEPVAPTGASYVTIDHAGAAHGANLRVEAEWEDYGRMRWMVVKLDASGRTLDEIAIPSTDLATQAAMTVENLDGVDRLLVVGVNVGGTERPFDPDDAPWEPHGWLLTVAARGPR